MSITMIGLDTAKSVFQVHGVNETGKVEIIWLHFIRSPAREQNRREGAN